MHRLVFVFTVVFATAASAQSAFPSDSADRLLWVQANGHFYCQGIIRIKDLLPEIQSVGMTQEKAEQLIKAKCIQSARVSR